MTCLTGVPEGGETVFPIQGIEVKPECDKTLILIARWIRVHSGGLAPEGRKCFVTGWMHSSDNGVKDPT